MKRLETVAFMIHTLAVRTLLGAWSAGADRAVAAMRTELRQRRDRDETAGATAARRREGCDPARARPLHWPPTGVLRARSNTLRAVAVARWSAASSG